MSHLWLSMSGPPPLLHPHSFHPLPSLCLPLAALICAIPFPPPKWTLWAKPWGFPDGPSPPGGPQPS